MSKIVDDMLAIAEAEAKSRFPAQERCGVVVKDGAKMKLIECRNISSKPETRFRMHPEDWGFANVDHEVLAIWHTHPESTAEPTQADLIDMQKHGLPWYIVSYPEGKSSFTEPGGYEAPYENRVFVHGTMDCYSLFRDWYKRERGIELIDEDRWDNWWNLGHDLYLEGLERNGFVKIPATAQNLKTNLSIGDGILMMNGKTQVPNHIAVYLGDGKILHHVQDRLSGIMPYGGYWLKHTCYIIRHRDFL